MQPNEAEFTRLIRVIQRHRQRKRWTVNHLADLAGVSPQYLGDMEKGKGSRPGVKIIARLARALNATIDALLIEAGWMEPPKGWTDGRPPLDIYLRDTQNLRDDDIAALSHIVRRLGEPPQQELRVAEEPAPYDPDEPARTDNLAAADEDPEQYREAQGWIDEEPP